MKTIAFITACVLASSPAIARAEAPSPAPATETPTAAPTAAPPATAEPTAAAPGWDDEPVSPPPPRVTPATAPATDLQPPPPPPQSRAGKGLIIGGVTLVGVGATSLLFIAAPAALVKRVALDRAERDDAIGFSTKRERYARARHADNTMEGAFWVGISALVLGTALAITGGVIKSRARSRAMARIGGGPGGVAIRF